MSERLPDLPKGEVAIVQFKPGWWTVQIGRTRYTKRFNLSTAEAVAIVERFTEAIGDLGGIVAGGATHPPQDG